MIIRYTQTRKFAKWRDIFQQVFSIYFGENDESDYVLEIVVLGRAWDWYIYR